MSTTTIQRWTIATLALLGILWLDLRFGHAIALSTMLGLMLVVAIYGGSGRGYGRRSGAAGPKTAGPDGAASGPEIEGPRSPRAGGPDSGDAESGR